MRGATAVNDECEVGLNRRFKSRWHWAQITGRLLILIVGACVLFGRGPYSHDHRRTADGLLGVDYEPISRHSAATTFTFPFHALQGNPEEVRLLEAQRLAEPLGFQQTTPRPDYTSVADDGSWLYRSVPPSRQDVLIRLTLKPDAVGQVPVHPAMAHRLWIGRCW